MKTLHLSAECYPIAKIGGLADVVGALPKYQNSLGVESQVVMPFYDIKFTQDNIFTKVYSAEFKLGTTSYKFEVLKPKTNILGFEIFLIDIPELLFTPYVYSNDDTDRFLSFQIAALNWILQLKEKPDVIHCHDHHTGLIPFMMSHCNAYKSLQNIPTVLTIHNAQYQGWFSHDKVNYIPKFDLTKMGLLDWDNCINPLATAIKCAWRVTTVSPNYMEELKVEANGLQALIKAESDKCIGILNGIDFSVWNPETDAYLIKHYAVSSVQSGKNAHKKWLCKEFELDPKKPLLVFIGRLVVEKGSDLFPEVFEKVIKNSNVSILLLGSGDELTQKGLQALKENNSGSYNAFIGYDEALSHKMYAGADFLIMPSRVEPCGLNQMYSLRYGTIPVVSTVGGLKDTVIDIEEGGFGICFDEVDVPHIIHSIERAIKFYEDQNRFRKTRKRIMKIDHSWDASAQSYITLYNSLN